ncbi:arginase family-domain-containing protein [Mycena rebaudengoi]|nr:arginase family-domain-containing protein [Mycena rebaudengoi]
MLSTIVGAALAFGLVHAHFYDVQKPMPDLDSLVDVANEPWGSKYGAQYDLGYTGPLSFSHLPYTRCLDDGASRFDIAIVGMPHDTTTSYRPGARFGPFAIRAGSRRQRAEAYSMAWGTSATELGSAFLDCGDASIHFFQSYSKLTNTQIPTSPVDNAKAIDQMETAYSTLLSRPVQGGTTAAYKSRTAAFAKDGKEHPRLITLGGDHTIVLPILRSLHKVYGPVSVIHFDAHLDTWSPPPGSSDQERINHGSFFAIAAEEGLMTNTSIHAGIRCHMNGPQDLEHDDAVGFQLISTDDIDDYGVAQIIKKIRKRIGKSPVYLSLDIDVVDPALAPATGTPEPGGWTTREVKRILRGLAGLNFVGADIVEVAPAYDNADITGIAAADLVHDFMTMLQLDAPPPPHVGPFSKADLLHPAWD